MTAGELNNLCNNYNLSAIEISCILLNFVLNNKSLAFSYTISYSSKAKNKDILAQQYFRRESVQRFIAEQKNNYLNLMDEGEKSSDVQNVEPAQRKKKKALIDISETGISGENIKELLEAEFERTTDPEKRTVLLIKIADFIGLKNNDQDDPLTPTIYLPSRCQSCTLKK